MKRPPRVPGAEDQAALAAAMVDVIPLADHGRVVHDLPRPRPERRHRTTEIAGASGSQTQGLSTDTWFDKEAGVHFVRPGVARQSLRDLRRGRWAIQAQIDLHGLTREEAAHALGAFLSGVCSSGHRCVRVIHGRGLSSPGGLSILRSTVRGWLCQRHEVLAWTEAAPHDGGEGAVLVLLRAARKE